MRKSVIAMSAFVLALALVALPILADNDDCTKIKDGVLLNSNGEVIKLGFDRWGYNYQAHMFNGLYSNYSRPDPPVTEDDVRLVMWWNDAWLSNKDCDGDGKLDRHYGYTSYIGSGAWETNHQWGTYELDGKTCRWEYFVKIVAAPADAHVDSGYWYSADGTEIGPVIWGAFAIVMQVYNDPCDGFTGIEYLSPIGPGFGKFKK